MKVCSIESIHLTSKTKSVSYNIVLWDDEKYKYMAIKNELIKNELKKFKLVIIMNFTGFYVGSHVIVVANISHGTCRKSKFRRAFIKCAISFYNVLSHYRCV